MGDRFRTPISSIKWPVGRARLLCVAGEDGTQDDRFMRYTHAVVAPAIRAVYPNLDVKPIRFNTDGRLSARAAHRIFDWYCRQSAAYDVLITYVFVHGTTWSRERMAPLGSPKDLYSTQLPLVRYRTTAGMGRILPKSSMGEAAAELADQLMERSEVGGRGIGANEGLRFEGRYLSVRNAEFKLGDPIYLRIDKKVHTVRIPYPRCFRQPHGVTKEVACDREFIADVVGGAIHEFLYYMTKAGITGEDFASSFRKIPKTPIIAIFSSCFSGSLLDDQISRCPNVVALLTSSSANEYSRVVKDRDTSTMAIGVFGDKLFSGIRRAASEKALGMPFLAAQSGCSTLPEDPQRPQALFRVRGGRLAINGSPHRFL